MVTDVEAAPSAPPGARPPDGGRALPGTRFAAGQLVKILLLGLTAAIAIWGAFPLIDNESWIGLGILAAATAAIFWVYLSPRRIAAKYLIPGTVFLIVFQIFPVLYTVSTAFTNFGDGHRGTKAEAITAVEVASVQRVPGSTEYQLSIGTTGDPATGPIVFLLTDPDSHQPYAGDATGLHELDAGDVTRGLGGRITAVRGYTVLTVGQASARSDDITKLAVPVDNGAIRSQGLSRAYQGEAARQYEKLCGCIREIRTGRVWRADDEHGYFVDPDGGRLPQGWKVTVGLRNFTAAVTDPAIRTHFAGILGWNLAFALGSVLLTFVAGLFFAIALNSDRLRFRRAYRVLLVLPYAMPSFAMLLVWRDMFNTDFGLLNRLIGVHVDWFGEPWTARIAVLLVQLWLGYPYMFLVATGALQAIPKELTEAAAVDGAKPWQAFRQVTLPLLLVALSPVLISSFAFNFNNFNAIYLTTEGGPFPADSPTAGATDLLITYTYRLAFGGQGSQYGFAAAISLFIFAIVAIISAVSFRRTRAFEEVN